MKDKLSTTYLKYPGIEDVDMLDVYVEEYKKMFPDYHAVSRDNYEEKLKIWDEHRRGIGTNGVLNNFCWLIDNERIIGICTFNVNPEVDIFYKTYAGHISYAIHPKYRGQGYGTIACHLLLKKCLEKGIEEAMITCLDDNEASKGVILNNNGVLKDKIEDDKGKINCRYIIDVKESIKRFEEKYKELSHSVL